MRQIKIVPKITNRESASLDKYLSEIGREALISPEEEASLARRIHEGDEEAINQLAKANLRFVVSVAKQYQGQGLSLSDLVSDGNVGLITAAKRFDETRGFKFISFAVWWIRQSIMHAINERGRMIRLPLNQINMLGKINEFYRNFVQINERRPTLREIAEALQLSVERVADTLACAHKHLSVDVPLGDGDESTMVDTLEDKSMETPDVSLLNDSLTAEVENSLRLLPSREREIVRMFFGIGQPEMTIDEISEKLGLSHERTRQIKEKAIRMLRNGNKNKKLRNYLG